VGKGGIGLWLFPEVLGSTQSLINAIRNYSTTATPYDGFQFFLRIYFKINFHHKVKRTFAARHPWLMPVILTTPKAETRRITIQGQLRQIVGRPYLQWSTLHG
jgi:hypothetical protein